VTWIAPLPVAIPLLTAAVVAGGDHVLPRRVQDLLGILAAATTCALGIVLMLAAESHEVVHWFGGWRTRGGIPLGIDFAVDPLAAGLAALAGGVTLLGLVYSLTYLREAARLFDTLMLVCCGAMSGFALSGDLFNMFVWLELMGVAGYALTGFEIRRLGPLQGAVNFAITNTVGGFFVLIGIALVYGRTGALNLAQIGHVLGRGQADGLVVVAFTLLVCGFFCKSAIVPFHLWLADAYAVAPVPVCVMFAGAMTDIGVFGVARVYWTSFAGPLGAHGHAVGDVLIWLGIVTALVGGVMAFLQRHLKRMLAYSVVCHIGIMLAGVGLLSSKGLAGAADVLLAHALLTGGLFLAVGVLLAWRRSVDELRLHGRGGDRPWLGVIWAVAVLGLTGTPYLGDYLGHAQIDDAAAAVGRAWVPPFLWLGGALAGAALLRAGARVFLGWGSDVDPLLSPERDEAPPRPAAAVPFLVGVTGVAVVLGTLVSVAPGLAQRSEYGAERFSDRAAYAGRVLHGLPVPTTPRPPFAVAHTSLESVLYGVAATVLALALAALGLYRRRLPGTAREAAGRLLAPPLDGLRALHSGVIGDYIMWVTVGTALIGGVWALTIR
jgi:multicomponent Na+:H+ antiporter subunit D